MRWLVALFKPKPCDCDGCTGRVQHLQSGTRVSNGLHVEVGADGKLHWRAKSRIVQP